LRTRPRQNPEGKGILTTSRRCRRTLPSGSLLLRDSSSSWDESSKEESEEESSKEESEEESSKEGKRKPARLLEFYAEGKRDVLKPVPARIKRPTITFSFKP
jgi:hypothetical protein